MWRLREISKRYQQEIDMEILSKTRRCLATLTEQHTNTCKHFEQTFISITVNKRDV